MLNPDHQFLSVLDYASAMNKVQAMELKGDFSNKGIFKLLTTTFEYTEKFSSSKKLPTAQELQEELNFTQEKIDNFLQNLGFNLNPPAIRKLNFLEYIPSWEGQDPGMSRVLKLFTVFARPTGNDGHTAYHYVLELNSITSDSITRYFRLVRNPSSKEMMREKLRQVLPQNKLYEMYASTEIGNLFQCPFDQKFKTKDQTIQVHLRPVLKTLVDNEVLLFVRNDDSANSNSKSVFYWNHKTEIQDRVEVYLDYAFEVIVPKLKKLGVIQLESRHDLADEFHFIKDINAYLTTESHGDEKTLLQEILLLSIPYKEEKLKQEKEEENRQLEELQTVLKGAGHPQELDDLRLYGESIPDKFIQLIMGDLRILSVETLNKKNEFATFVLHKDSISQAVEFAMKVFQDSGNYFDMALLEQLGVKNLILDNSILKKWKELESQNYYHSLSWWTKLRRWIFGNKTANSDEIKTIKAKKKLNHDALLEKEREKAQQKKIKSKAMKRLEDKELKAKTSNSSKEDPQEKKKRESSMAKILDELDRHWEEGTLPDVAKLVQAWETPITEQAVEQFIKNHMKSEVFSYKIRNQFQKYPLPILVTRRYLKKYRNPLLEAAQKEWDSVRLKLSPNQEVYDKAVSLLSFLEKTLPKL
jgi:hypothetical protein